MTDSGILHQLSETFGLVFYPSMCIFFICILLTNTNQPGSVEDAVKSSEIFAGPYPGDAMGIGWEKGRPYKSPHSACLHHVALLYQEDKAPDFSCSPDQVQNHLLNDQTLTG